MTDEGAELLARWVAHLSAAARDSGDPLHGWARVALQTSSGGPAEALRPLVECWRKRATEASGAVFSGRKARTISSRKNHGSDKNKSDAVCNAPSRKPPIHPAPTPANAAAAQETRAAAGASVREIRVPYHKRVQRSRPSASVPSAKAREGGASGWSRNCVS